MIHEMTDETIMADASRLHTEAHASARAVLDVQGLGKHVTLPGGELTILDDIGFRIGHGDTVAIVGASGSGKSTLLGLLAGLDVPTRGTVRLFGEDVAAKGGVYGVTRGLHARFGAGRVFDTLLDETSILGLALGSVAGVGTAAGVMVVDGVKRTAMLGAVEEAHGVRACGLHDQFVGDRPVAVEALTHGDVRVGRGLDPRVTPDRHTAKTLGRREEVQLARRRGVRLQRLLDTGLQLRYPDFKTGYADLLASYLPPK